MTSAQDSSLPPAPGAGKAGNAARASGGAVARSYRRLFHDREVILRSEGRIRFYRVRGATQAMAVGLAALVALTALSSSMTAWLQNSVLADRTRQLVETVRSNADLRERAGVLRKDLMGLQSELAQHRSRLATSEREKVSHLGMLSSLANKVRTLENALAEVNDSTDGLRARIGTLSKELELTRYKYHAMVEKQKLEGYDLSKVRVGEQPVPRVLPAALPREIRLLTEPTERKQRFIQHLLPIVLELNNRVLRQRARLIALEPRLERGEATSAETDWLEGLAADFGVDLTAPDALSTLVRRVDAVPPSLALAQAAEESGWGTSRFAQDGNAVFGQRTWDEEAGIVPAAREENARFAVKRFDTLVESVADYIHNLNTHGAYAAFRIERATMRRERNEIDGFELARQLIRYSERGADYVQQIRRIMRDNRLWQFDEAQLEQDEATPSLRDRAT